MKTKPWYQSKTIIFNLIGLLVLLVGVFVDNYHALGIEVPAQAAAWLAMVVLLGNAILRFLTTQPIAGGPDA